MVKGGKMLISEFARASGLSVDTVRYYVRRGLLVPEFSAKGGRNQYQIFTQIHVGVAQQIRLAQLLGFSLKEIDAEAQAFRDGHSGPDRGLLVLQTQLARLEEQAQQLACMQGFIRAKIADLEREKANAATRGPDN